MTKEEIVTALLDDMEMPYLQDWQARDIVDFVLKKYTEGLPTIKGWVARGAMPRDLDFYTGDKPQRMKGRYAPYWSPINGNVYELPDEIGDQFTIEFEDEPIEVELQIKRI